MDDTGFSDLAAVAADWTARGVAYLLRENARARSMLVRRVCARLALKKNNRALATYYIAIVCARACMCVYACMCVCVVYVCVSVVDDDDDDYDGVAGLPTVICYTRTHVRSRGAYTYSASVRTSLLPPPSLPVIGGRD